MAAATTALNDMIATADREAACRSTEDRQKLDWRKRLLAPRDALYVPPPPETVPAYMDDMIEFANRTDIPVLIQPAVAHAQFESIHPFTDGNGRIGRALINTIFRRRGATTRLVIPLASALVAYRERYFGALNTYRNGDLRPLIVTFANSAKTAAAKSCTTAERVAEIPIEWRRDQVWGASLGLDDLADLGHRIERAST